MHFLSHAVPAAFGFDDRFVEKVGKIIGVSIRAQDNIAATAAIAAIRSAFRDKFLPSKADAASAAAPRLRKNFNPIDKHFFLNN